MVRHANLYRPAEADRRHCHRPLRPRRTRRAGVRARCPASGELTISPSPAAFPKTTVGHHLAREFQVANESGEEVGIEGVGIEGADAGDFIFNGTSCGGPLPSGQHCSVWVTFAPGGVGAKQATLTVRVNGEQEPFELSGESVPPQLSFQPGSYDFGLQYVNSGSSSANFELTNTGEATVQLNNLDTPAPAAKPSGPVGATAGATRSSRAKAARSRSTSAPATPFPTPPRCAPESTATRSPPS